MMKTTVFVMRLKASKLKEDRPWLISVDIYSDNAINVTE